MIQVSLHRRSLQSLPNGRSRGVALIITLSFLVLVTFAAVAFLSQALSSRKTEDVSSAIVETDLLARSALEVVTTDLRAEMQAGSTLHITDDITVLQPAPLAMNPQRVLVTGVSSTDTNYASLRKQSVGRFFSASAPTDRNKVTPIIQATTGVATSTASANGRVVTGARWDSPKLLFENATFANSQTPEWIIVTRAGIPASQSWNSAFRDASPSNKDFVKGRFAYQIYDVGGLLDANVAGHAGGVTTTDLGSKGSLGLAELGAIPGVTNADTFVSKWRNTASGASPSDFLAYLGLSANATNTFYNLGPKSGFRKPAATSTGSSVDSLLVGRQDLIKLAQNGSFGITTAALPYLTHFTRELNAPSWGPVTPSGSSIDYAARANDASAENRFLPNVRFVEDTTLTRYDDTAVPRTESVQAGSPLVQRRFSLARLSWLAAKAANPGDTSKDAAIRACFGLVWNDGKKEWDYCSSGTTLASGIKTLAQVAAQNREPDFFELLKAGILSGSLGVDGGGNKPVAPAIPSLHEADADLQILQIGANLMDQFDADSYPSRIQIDRAGLGWEAVGIENLPFLTQYKLVAGKSPDAPGTSAALYFLFNLWNPHRATPALPTTRPDIQMHIKGNVNVVISTTTGTGIILDYQNPDPDVQSIDSTVPLTSAVRDGYLEPGILTASGIGSAPNWGPAPAELGGSYAGFRINDMPVKGFFKNTATTIAMWIPYYSNDPFQIMLEYKDPAGNWRAYSQAHGINDSATWRQNGYIWVANGKPDTTTTPYSPLPFLPASLNDGPQQVAIDPRTRRFTSMQFGGSICSGLFANSLWPTSQANGFGSATQSGIQLVPTKIWSAGSSTYPALLSRNNSAASRYKDADSVSRFGDSGYFTGAGTSGNPFGVSADRPVILNRPFRSVAEMGYGSRDMPFRSLDFFTDKSPDAALLDLFCISDTPVSVRAGVVNLNTTQATVLEAVLRATTTDVASAATLSDTDAAAIASSLVAGTAVTPLTNPADLAGRIAAISTIGNRKVDRETIARALAGPGQTRTWNLLVDLVAQSGRFGVAADNLSQFIVKGERRYWMHLAIDRFTGQVVDSQIEPVQD